jgi:tetratricopeptide (TPR) repeat protein
MSPDRSHQETSPPSIDECLNQIRYARAAELARTGSYLEAEALLTPNGRLPDTSRELDLLARIAAQQERFDDAARLWNAALKTEPDNLTYKEALQRLSDLRAEDQTPPPSHSSTLAWCVATGAILMLIAMFISTHREPAAKIGTLATTSSTNAGQNSRTSDLPASPTNPATAPAVMSPALATLIDSLSTATAESSNALRRAEKTLDQLQHFQQEQIRSLNSQLTAIQATNSLLLGMVHTAESRLANLAKTIQDLSADQAVTHHAVDSARSEITTLLAAYTSAAANNSAASSVLADFNPAISGVTVTATTNGCLIRFDSGLFDRDCHFKTGAKERLQALAKALVQTQARFKIQVIGTAEDEPPTWPWAPAQNPEALALQRGQCATAYLLHIGIFPPDKLSAAAGILAQRPFPSPNRNNRSVMLQVLTELPHRPATAP